MLGLRAASVAGRGPARSWQQDGLLIEDEGGRRLRGGGGGDEAKARLEASMRKAEAEVVRTQGMEVSLLVKSFFEAPVEAVLQRMAGAGGRRPSVAEAREVARRARAAGERAPPPPSTATSRAEAARAATAAAAAERRSRALEAELREVRRARCDAEERRRARLEGTRGGGGDDGGGDVQGDGGRGVQHRRAARRRAVATTTVATTTAVWTAAVLRRRLRQGVWRGAEGARLLVRRPEPAPARRAGMQT